MRASLGDGTNHEQKWPVPLRKPNKRRNVGKTLHWGAFVQPLLQWKSNKYRTFWVCVCVALSIQHAMRMRHIVICGLSGCAIFFHIISQTVWFYTKKLLYVKCAFWFSLQLLSEIFLIRRKIQRGFINVYWSSCKVPAIPVGLNSVERFWKNTQT